MFHLRHWNQQVAIQTWHETFNQLISLIMDRRLRLMMPANHYDLTEVHKAIRAVQSSERNKGKIFLTS